DESLVLHMQYGETSALLVGDAHRRIEKLLVDEAPQADLLKVGHHGSATSSTAEFLAAVKPRFALVSVGFYNSFGHPRPDVMERYAEAEMASIPADSSKPRTTIASDSSSVSNTFTSSSCSSAASAMVPPSAFDAKGSLPPHRVQKTGLGGGPGCWSPFAKGLHKLAAKPTFRCMMPPTTMVRNRRVVPDI